MSTYVFDQAWEDERRRHAGIARLWDAGTFELLARLGVAPGWRCVEIGAGAGSVARWLAERVGREGHVLATDLDTGLLNGLDAPGVVIRPLDVLADELPVGSFDLVYARLLVEHVGAQAINRMLPALRPGGLLVVEDYDCAVLFSHPPSDAEERVNRAIIDVMSRAGWDPYLGRKLAAELISAGLMDVRAEGRACVVRGGTPEADFARLTLLALRARMVDAALVSEEGCDAALQRYDDPSWFRVGPMMVAAWGRAPS
jgi:ubiquinone/menaquinone biosynthesis C-methylase UbiE